MEKENIELSYCNETKFVKKTGEIEEYSLSQRNQLFSKLKEYRLAQSQKINMPAYFIFDNATLTDITNILPSKVSMLWLISGFGETKIELYGKDIVKIVSNFLDELKVSKILYGKNSMRITPKLKPVFGYLDLLNYFSQTEVKTYNANADDFEQLDSNKIVEVNKKIKVILNDEVFNFTILESKTSFRPVWTGQQDERFGYEEAVESEADPTNNHTISDQSPLALAILGKNVGDNFSYIMNDITFTGKILSVK